MFKGLRTKIESEQNCVADRKPSTKTTQLTATDFPKNIANDNNQPHRQNVENAYHSNVQTCSESKDSLLNSTITPESTKSESVSRLGHVENKNGQSSDDLKNDETINGLNQQIVTLKQDIFAIKKNDADQQQQLHNLIKQLEKDLEIEKNNNSSLQGKLDETRTILIEKSDLLQKLTNNRDVSTVNKPFNPNLTVLPKSNISSVVGSCDEDVKKQIDSLQYQLTEKTRQLRLTQQNLNDVKRTLQREVQEHAKTQSELKKIQSQLKDLILNKNGGKDQSETANLHNGSNRTDSIDLRNTTGQENGSVTNNVSPDATRSQPGSQNEVDETTTTPSVHLDSISYMSKSSADEYDPHDLQSNSNKEVNHEYLKNVLFRYMTSTDTETTQHLVKALSVLMNFSPDQSAAIKSAIQSKSSWLRLK